MVHAGAIVEKAVRRSGISIAELARKVSVNRRSLYNWFAQETLSMDCICKIGFAIGHDFSNDFPEHISNAQFMQLKRFIESPQEVDPADFEKINFWKNKYISLLEQYNDLLVKKTANITPKEETAA